MRGVENVKLIWVPAFAGMTFCDLAEEFQWRSNPARLIMLAIVARVSLPALNQDCRAIVG